MKRKAKVRMWSAKAWAFVRNCDGVWAKWEGDHSNPGLYARKESQCPVPGFRAVRVSVTIRELPRRGAKR